ncbi:MAG: hypothetical protein C0605_01945 [Hyphomicrobiales bacterium]|nr:MAG: hypothetical protein C0605_01945 [Hyphomicrobiales bacterium]
MMGMFTPKLKVKPIRAVGSYGAAGHGAPVSVEVGGPGRFLLVISACALCFAVIGLRLADIALVEKGAGNAHIAVADSRRYERPDLTDRNGNILAKDLYSPSLYADAGQIIDVDEVVEKLSPILTELTPDDLDRKLRRKSAFIWLKRGLTPKQQSKIHALGLPGLGFVREKQRVYPNGRIAAHVLGHVNIDNRGIAGIEKYIDRIGLSNNKELTPLALSIDLRAQHVVSKELAAALITYKAKAATAVVLDVHTGEVLALSSLPDYDPNAPSDALKPDNLNRMTAGVYELGSVFKTFTVAMALDEGVATLKSRYDARSPIRKAGFKIDDFHAQRRVLTVPEVFIYSSNIGAAKMAEASGIKTQKAFLRKLGLLDRMQTELPESRNPLYPKDWKPLNMLTIAFGHGLAVSPLQAAAAAAALVNGGKMITPTFLCRSEARALFSARQVISPETSAKMRYLMRLNVTKGTARKADVPGFRVGGKTGTAEKPTRYGYSKNKLLTSFMGTFPADAPRYLILVMLDEPKGIPETHGYATSGWNAAPVTARIVKRIAPMLGVLPAEDGEQAGAGAGTVLANFKQHPG